MRFFNDLYKAFGVRKADQLINPPHPKLSRFEFPRESIFHYFPSGDLDHAPDTNEPLFDNVTKSIYISHVTEQGDKRGNPRRLSIVAEPLLRDYHIKHRRFKRMIDLGVVSKDPSALVVYNYGFMTGLYTMQRTAYSNYFTWWNRRAALWDKVAELTKESSRQQFILMRLPKSLPTIMELAWADGDMTASALKMFADQETYEFIELWKWFGHLRKETLMNKLPRESLDRINFIIMDKGSFFYLNLGTIEQFRKSTKEDIRDVMVKLGMNPDAKGAPKFVKHPTLHEHGIPPEQLQRRLLKSALVLVEMRSEANKGDVAVTPDNKDAKKEDPKAPARLIPTMNKETGEIELKAKILDGEDEQLIENAAASIPDDQNVTDYDEVYDGKIDERIHAELEEIAKITATIEKVKRETTVVDEKEEVLVLPSAPTLEDGIAKVCARLAEQDAITASELMKYTKLSNSYKEIRSPDGKTTMEQFIKVPHDIIKIDSKPIVPDIKTVIDKSMLKSSLNEFDAKYSRDVLPKHIASMALHVQQAGIAVTGYEVERIEDAIGAYDSVTIRNTPVIGQSSTWHIKVPAVEEDGTWKANGIRYRMRKQRVDLPIRKVGPSLVALTSYYGKMFVQRSEKRVNNYTEWLCNALTAKGFDEVDVTVQDVHPGDVFDNEFQCPRLFSALASRFRSLKVGGFILKLDITDDKERKEFYGEKLVNQLEKDGARIIGRAELQTRTIGSLGKRLLVVDKNDALYTFHPGVDRDMKPEGSIESMAHLELSKTPVEFAEIRILGREIPVGVVLAFEIGFDNLCKLLKVTPRRVQAGTRVNLDVSEYQLVFKDETLVFSKQDRHAALFLAGFNEYSRQLKEYDQFHFNKRDVYLNILEADGPAARYLREIDLAYQMFVDPITKQLLEQMGEPVHFRGLLLRACEMLMNDQHPDAFDTEFQRFRGNERIAGAVYSELVKAIREHGGRSGRNKLPIDLHPYAVWKNISTDSSNALISEINPVQNLKEQEAVTTAGTGGRSSRSMTKSTRGYPEKDKGVISESTVDSSDVGINTYTSANPQFNSLLGTTNRYVKGQTGAASLLSTSALLSPGSDADDPKRVNFIAIQRSHTIACEGYHQMPVRTGYEQVLAHRTGDLFAITAKEPGKVIEVNAKGIIVEYDGGRRQGYELGRRFGNAAGLTLPHNIITPLKEGQKFKEGAPICYNDGFFEPDYFNPGNIVWKQGILVNVALMESTMTLEDSSSISPRVAELLSTKTTKVNTIVVRFNQKVNRLIKAGTVVDPESILCVIEDEVTANAGLLDEETLDTLSVLSSMVPQAKVNGTVELVEVYYHGDKEDMNETLRGIAEASDRDMAKRLKAAGKKVFTGSVDGGFRVDGNPLALDTMAIRIYITGDVHAGIGDKGVFANQMKTVFGEVMQGTVTTRSGKVVDAIFGQKSIDDRIVTSPAKIGTSAALLIGIGKMAARMRGKKK